MPRPKSNRIKTNVFIDEENMANIQAYLMDPHTGRLTYGALQSILNELLRKFFAKMHEPGVDPVALLAHYGVEIQKKEKDKT